MGGAATPLCALMLLCALTALCALMTDPCWRPLAAAGAVAEPADLLFLRWLADTAACSSEGVEPVRLSSRSARNSALNRGLVSRGAVVF